MATKTAQKKASAAKKPVKKKTPAKKASAKKKSPTKRKPLTKKYRAALKKKNLKVFEKFFPNLHPQLLDFTPMSKLVIGDDGEPDTIFNDQYFYNKKHKQYCEDQMRGYKSDPQRFALSTLNPQQFDDYAAQFLHNLLLRATEEGMKFSPRPVSNEAYFTLCFGLGLGGFIDELVEFTKCHCLLLFEPSYEFIYHSLEVYDWDTLLKKFKRKKGKVQIFVGSNPELISMQIRATIRSTNAASLDGVHLFAHYNNAVFSRAGRLLMEDKDLIIAGLGFLDDEMVMIKNAHGNLYSGRAKIYLRPPDKAFPLPAFVVGSGPSLDRDIPYIKKLADKAIIIACGSAVRPLMVNGIVPDFQIEVENSDILPLMESVNKDYDLSPVCLVTSITGDREVLKFFKKTVFYFRGSLSPFPIFFQSEEQVLLHCSPTVSNAGLSFAQEIGCRKIFFFGTDMGSMDRDIHHSKDSYHYTEGAKFLDQIYNTPVPGNFGGTCYTSSGLYWAKDAMENAIKAMSRGRVYYNCANGALIEGANTKTSRTIELDEPEKEKETTVAELIDSFPAYTKKTFEELWQDETVVDSMKDYIGKIRKVIDNHKNFSNKRYLTNLVKHLEGQFGRLEAACMLIFRGSIYMTIMCLEFYHERLQNRGKLKEFQKIAREELEKTLDILLNTAIEEVGSLSAKKEARKKKKTSKKKAPAKKFAKKKAAAKKVIGKKRPAKKTVKNKKTAVKKPSRKKPS